MATGGDKKGGFFLTLPIAILLGVLAIGTLVGIGLLVWFKSPRHECPVRTDQEICNRYLELYGKESVCRIDEAPDKQGEDEDKKPTGLRLNDTLVPSHYAVELWPRLFGDFGFNGSVTMDVTCATQTDVIVLHVDEVTVQEESIEIKNKITGEVLSVDSVEEDAPRQFFKIYMSQALKPSRSYTFSMQFNGTLIHTDWRGFYRSSYKEGNQTYWMATTQFQRTHARRAFPCFDEPALKATFNITLVRQANYTSISNMPIVRSEARGAGWVADVYAPTVIMPTYLLAFVISQFEYVESIGPKGLPIRIWTRPTFKKYAEYSSNYTGAFINAFEEWTGISYALPKLDQIAIPDFRSGAMENWGLVTYRETALLYNPEYSDISDRRWVASVVAHELAHMWFGNLVTCNWWDDTFLNEGSATYFGDLVGMETVMPEYEMDEFFLRRVFYIMNFDGNAKSQPVFVDNLEHHDDLMKAFDRITYYKGGAILRMIKYFLTERTFRRGIQKYLQKYQYSTVVHEDLYKELQQQAMLDSTDTWDTAKTNLSGILDTWIEQQNYPIIHVSDPEGGKVTFNQTHFLYDKEAEIATPTNIGPKFIWDVPLTYGTKTELMSGSLPTGLRIKWMHREEQIELPISVGSSEWLIVNLYMQGYYRVKYGPKTWIALIAQLIEDHTVIPVENRAALLDDAFRLAQAEELPEVEALRATQYLTKETEYLPFRSYISRLSHYLNMFYDTPVYDELEMYARNLVIPSYQRAGWTVRDVGHEHLDRYTRIIVLSQACYRNYKPCVDEAKNLLNQFMDDPSYDPIPPDLRGMVYCVAVQRGGIREWDFMVSQYERNYGDVYIAYQNSSVLGALSCPTMPHVIRKALDYALSKNSTSLFTAVIGNRGSKDTSWNYITEHWDSFKDGNTTRISQTSILTAATSSWHSAADLRKLEAFMTAHPDPDLQKTYEAVKKTVQKNIDWLEVNMEPIKQFLIEANAGNTTTTSTGTTQGRRRKRSLATDIEFERSQFSDIRLRTEF